MKKYKRDILDLTTNFSLDLFRFLRKKSYNSYEKHIVIQIFRSSSSIAANCIEAKQSSTKKALRYRYTIALREAKETQYWMKFIKEILPNYSEDIENFSRKLSEITAIIYSTVKRLNN